MLSGNNGILSKATDAKKNTIVATEKEQLQLATMASLGTNGSLSIDTLKSNVEKDIKDATHDNATIFPLTVTYTQTRNAYEIDSKGNVKEVEGIRLSQNTIKLIAGQTKELTAYIRTGLTGTVHWSSSNDNIAVVNNGNVTGVANIGTTTITAKITDQSTARTYTTTCIVNMVQAVTNISVSNLTVSKGRTENLEIALTPSTGEVEDLIYQSSNEDIATVDNNGTVTGITTGTATITVSGSYSSSIKDTCTVTVEPSRVSVTAAQIAANPERYYGQEVKNYTAGGKIYRIFYVDTAGDFGEANTIYLKADWTDNNVNLYRAGASTYSPKTTSVLEKMNPDWWNARSTTSWNNNEKCASYLCDPTTSDENSNQAWVSYFDSTKANYAIGSPSVEMYVKSYNQVPHTVGNYTLGVSYSATNNPGYIYTVNRVTSTLTNGNDYSTGDDSLDYSGYHSMYCGKNGSKGSYYTWLASPSSYAGNRLCCILGDAYGLTYWASQYNSYTGNTRGISPIISLKSGVLPEILE